MIVSNTTPLRYLVEVDAIGILPGLFCKVTTTPAVLEELLQAHFPQKVRGWALNRPDWLMVESPQSIAAPIGAY